MEVNSVSSCELFETVIDGRAVPVRRWGKPGGHTAVLVHGLGAHSGWFETFGAALAQRGLTAVAADHAGFGLRGDEKATGGKWIADLRAVYEAVEAQSKSVCVMANSMGALVAMPALTDKSPAGLVMFSPGFDGGSSFSLPWRLKTMAKALLTPELKVALPYTTCDITQSASGRKFVDEDPLGKMIVPAGVMLEVLKISNAASRIRNVSFPVLLFTSGQDVIVSTSAARRFFARLTAPSKMQRHFEKAYHDLMFEPCLNEVADLAVQWHARLI